jgi:hypothetical protein
MKVVLSLSSWGPYTAVRDQEEPFVLSIMVPVMKFAEEAKGSRLIEKSSVQAMRIPPLVPSAELKIKASDPCHVTTVSASSVPTVFNTSDAKTRRA